MMTHVRVCMCVQEEVVRDTERDTPRERDRPRERAKERETREEIEAAPLHIARLPAYCCVAVCGATSPVVYTGV